MLIVLLTNRKDYELFLSDVVFAFDGLEDFGFGRGESLILCGVKMEGGKCKGVARDPNDKFN